MVRAGAVVTVLAIIVTIVVAIRSNPQIDTETLTIEVPSGPQDGDTISLDAMLYLPSQTPAPAIILAHGFGSDRRSLDQTARLFAAENYVVLAYSARGFGASEGLIGLNDPDREVADVSRLADLLATRDEIIQEGPEDPLVGIAGGSYGGGLALLAATQEPRLDAVVAAAAWNRLSRSLSPNQADQPVDGLTRPGVFKEQWASVLFTSGAVDDIPRGDISGTGLSAGGDAVPTEDVVCGRFDPQICRAYAQAAITGNVDEQAAELLDRGSPHGRLDRVRAPTMLIAGQDDTLFGLDESLRNATEITNAPVVLRWVAGTHGQASRIDRDVALEWFDVHLRGTQTELPRFSWIDPASGTPQPMTGLPGSEATFRTFALSADGRLTDVDTSAEGDIAAESVVLVRPPGGLPASISTLPGLGDVGAFLPSVDVPWLGASFTSAALDTDLTLLGRPELTLPLDVSDQDATLFVKLYDVTPGGQTTLLQSAVNPTRPPTGQGELVMTLDPLAHRVVAGNRIRVTLDTTDQAYAIGREPSVVTLQAGPQARLSLPTVTTAGVAQLPAFVRVALPVLVVLALGLFALFVIRRHERTMASGQSEVTAATPMPGARTEEHPPRDPIVVRGLVKRYPDGKVAVDGVDLTVGRGQVFGLLGPNGAGKTTMLRLLLGLITPSEGEMRLLGQPMRPGHPVLQRVGVLVEGPGFAPYLTGRQNLVSYWRSGGRPLRDADLDHSLGIADLGAAIDKPTRTYSHGMRQRLAIAQALLGRPEVLILDEPTDGLDPEQIRAMRELLARLGQQGHTILVSSHLLGEVEQMCTHAAVLNAGKVVAAGSVAELVGGSHTLVVKTDDPARAKTVVATLVDPAAVRLEGAGLIIDLDGVDPATVVTALVDAGIRVSSAAPRGRLEDAFLALTGAAD